MFSIRVPCKSFSILVIKPNDGLPIDRILFISFPLFFRKLWKSVKKIRLKLYLKNSSPLSYPTFNAFFPLSNRLASMRNPALLLHCARGRREKCDMQRFWWHLPFDEFSKYSVYFWCARKLVEFSSLPRLRFSSFLFRTWLDLSKHNSHQKAIHYLSGSGEKVLGPSSSITQQHYNA